MGKKGLKTYYEGEHIYLNRKSEEMLNNGESKEKVNTYRNKELKRLKEEKFNDIKVGKTSNTISFNISQRRWNKIFKKKK